ncbi:MAG: ABC transporter ATP-binding protein [Desulfarculaceae bacterium]|nr:ABC transporter ATP-binding protein [Desulfarculaceae bacterium]MCF8074283.1 ABC transporter ATP-binding protein [Desulfarculaceae bacterium]MCF8103351.1 ABC transporter ATP-binding protein [Desulfarculaceae bacterium]MCF8117859.1 ABC transporter ATP-binding protein [Desulfarculaceae bacterium]
MLRVENLTVAYGKAKALYGVSMDVEEGELVTLLGSNGAGKSTLLKTISGLLKPTGGTITFKDRKISGMPSHKIVQMGVVQAPEGREVFPSLSVHDNLRMGAFTRRDDKAVDRDMEFVFELFPRLAERRNQAAGTMSGGEAQMLAIARSLLSGPKLLMLDEPSLGLAPVVREDIFNVVQQIYQERRVTILLVEQNAKWALGVASRAYIMENGRIVMQDQGSKLAENEHVQRAYLGY